MTVASVNQCKSIIALCNIELCEVLFQNESNIVYLCTCMQVREQELHKALCCLSDKFRIVCDSETRHDKALVESVLSQPIRPQPTSQLKCTQQIKSYVLACIEPCMSLVLHEPCITFMYVHVHVCAEMVHLTYCIMVHLMVHLTCVTLWKY